MLHNFSYTTVQVDVCLRDVHHLTVFEDTHTNSFGKKHFLAITSSHQLHGSMKNCRSTQWPLLAYICLCPMKPFMSVVNFSPLLNIYHSKHVPQSEPNSNGLFGKINPLHQIH